MTSTTVISGTPQRLRDRSRRVRALVVSLVACLAAMASAGLAPAEVPPPPRTMPEYDLKASFILSFVKFVTWPDSAFAEDDPTFTLAVVGKDPFGRYLDRYETKTLSIGSHRCRVAVARFDTPEDVGSCHVLFVSSSLGRNTRTVVTKVASQPILTIADSGSFVDSGGMVGLSVKSTKVRFEVNQDEAVKAGLGIRARLLKMAHRVVRQ